MTVTPLSMRSLPSRLWADSRRLGPGLALTFIIALAATYLSDHYKAPAIIFALLVGSAFNTLSAEPRYAPGVTVSARNLLRVSVALLGLRVTFSQLGELGWSTVALAASASLLTIGFGWAMSRLMKFDSRFGVLSGGAVGICGASAAMAIAVAWPRKDSERDTVVVIACITFMSTAGMLLYPALAGQLHLDPVQTGRFLGASLHDVAQVAGAGYSVSPKTGDVAIVVKLMRVTMLLPVVVALTTLVAKRIPAHEHDGAKISPLPGFLLGFVALALLNGFGLVPGPVTAVLTEVSKWLLVIAVAALGMKTSAREIMAVGRTAIVLVAAESLFIMLLALAWIRFGL